MFETKKRVRILWTTVCLSLVGTLTLTLIVFAKSDTSEHDKGAHYHTTSAQNTPEKVEWRVSIGDIDWSGRSTYVWHQTNARSWGSNRITVYTEWQHEVESKDPLPAPLHDTYYITDTFQAGKRGKQQVNRSGWTSVDLPKAGIYQIRAYTEVTMYRGSPAIELTLPPKNKRSIKSIWFEVD